MKQICFALGNIWTWNDSPNKALLLDHVRALDVDGVELTFATEEQLKAFNPSKENGEWLKSLDYVSIHAPFNLLKNPSGIGGVVEQLDLISDLYSRFNAGNVTIHPDQLPDEDLLLGYPFNISTENLPKRSRITIPMLEEVLDCYDAGFCLDVSHAYLWSKEETGKLVRKFHHRITQVNFSGTYKRKSHHPLRKVTKDFIYSIQPIRALDVPIVIEEDVKIRDIDFLQDEVGYIRELMG